jgi:putative transposase
VRVPNLSQSSKGTREQPGKQVRQKSGLNRAILDQDCGELRRQRAYKLDWNGAMVLAVPLHNTSRTCPACGPIAKENRQTHAQFLQFLCVDCGYENNADACLERLVLSVVKVSVAELREGRFRPFTPPRHCSFM